MLNTGLGHWDSEDFTHTLSFGLSEWPAGDCHCQPRAFKRGGREEWALLEMAGTLGAISSWVPKIPALFLYNNNRCASRSLVFKPACWNRPSVFSTVPRSLLTMAQADQINNSPEIKEPSPKVPKLGQNGVHEVTQGPASLLKVKKLSEKAVLPSRGSPLAAGYDLSR